MVHCSGWPTETRIPGFVKSCSLVIFLGFPLGTAITTSVSETLTASWNNSLTVLR